MAKHLFEASLVMVEPLPALIVDSADVDDYIASVEGVRVPSAFDVYSTVLSGHRATFIAWKE
jgi:hypothetical protein